MAKHRDEARALYGKRKRMLDWGRGDSELLLRVEAGLRKAIAGVIPGEHEAASEPTDDGTAFVACASRFLSLHGQAQTDAYEMALSWLAAGTPGEEGVLDALRLYPPPDGDFLVSHYERNPGLRTPLIRLWRHLGSTVPTDLIQQAALQRGDPELRYQALTYAAGHEGFGLEVFRPHYRNPRGGRSGGNPDMRLLVSAIWGGLVRSDEDARVALRHAVERAEEPEVRYALLRLMSMIGKTENLPILLKFIHWDPGPGYGLLALHGHVWAIPHIIKGLEQARSMEAAYLAWQRMTGVELPARPRLMLVRESGCVVSRKQTDDGEIELIPDVNRAKAWWACRQGMWDRETRLIRGQPMHAQSLIGKLKRKIGASCDDLLALTAIHLNRPLAIDNRGWECHRQASLEALAAKLPDRRKSPRVAATCTI